MGSATKTFRNGEIIVKEGDIGESFFHLVEGNAIVYAGYGKSDQVKIAVLNPGEFFGEMAIIDACPRNATVIAKGTVCIDEIPGTEMKKYFAENPDQIIVLMKHLGNRIQAMTRDYEDAKALLKEVRESDAGKKKSLFSKIKKHMDVYQSNKNKIPEPNADPLRETLETTVDSGFGKIESFSEGAVIYNEGDVDNCMYILHVGTVGLYKDYGGYGQTKQGEVHDVSFFGEMGMLVEEPRDVTAVAETEGTYVEIIYPEDLETIFRSCSIKIILILRYLSYRLRRLNIDFVNTCQEITEAYGKN